jgi:hypothetical protein
MIFLQQDKKESHKEPERNRNIIIHSSTHTVKDDQETRRRALDLLRKSTLNEKKVDSKRNIVKKTQTKKEQ